MTDSWKSFNSEAKFVYSEAKRVLMQLQPKIWKETSAGSYSLLNVKIILFTTSNFYCLLTRLRKSINVLVVRHAHLQLDFQERVKENMELIILTKSYSFIARNVHHEVLNQTLTRVKVSNYPLLQ